MLVGATAFVAWLIPWRLVLSPATPTGGDAHTQYAALVFFLREVLPNGRIWGWDPGALAGYPFMTLYFPLPFLAMAGAAQLLGPAAAFKLLSLLPALALPAAAFYCLRRLGLGFPGPGAGAVIMLTFLVQQEHAVWGGNMASLLAGEFCYGWALCLALVYLGRLPACLEGRASLWVQALLLTAVGLSHAYALLFVLAAGLYFLLEPGGLRRAGPRLFAVYALAFLLLAFWLVPLVIYSRETEVYGQVWRLTSWRAYLPPLLLPVLVLSGVALVGLFFSPGPDRRRGQYLAFWAVAGAGLYLAAPAINGVDIRYGPFVFVALGLLAAQALTMAARGLKGAWLWGLMILLAGLLWPGLHTGYLPDWLAWNNAGMEARPVFSHFQGMAQRLQGSYDDPRVAYEHSQRHQRLGSMRAWETLPLWSGRAVLEGLYIQASSMSPSIFYLQSLLGELASMPLPGYIYARPDLDRAVERLRLMNAGQVILAEPKSIARARAHPGLREEAAFGPYTLFRVEPPPVGYAVAPRCKPWGVVTSQPRRAGFQWLRFGDMDQPLVFLKEPPGSALAPRLAGWVTATPGELAAKLRGGWPGCVPQPASSPKAHITPGRVELSGLTPGRPVWVKVSYHPAWRVEGGGEIYRASPAFMLVWPRGEEMALVFGPAWPHWAGLAMTLMGLALLATVALRPGLEKWWLLDPGPGDAWSPGRPGLAWFGLAAAALLLSLSLLHHDASTLRHEARALDAAGEHGQAQAMLEKLIARHPLNMELDYSYYDLGLSHLAANEPEQCVRALEELVRRYPETRLMPEALYYLGLCRSKAGQDGAAAWQSLRADFPDSPWAARAPGSGGRP